MDAERAPNHRHQDDEKQYRKDKPGDDVTEHERCHHQADCRGRRGHGRHHGTETAQWAESSHTRVRTGACLARNDDLEAAHYCVPVAPRDSST